MRTVSYLQAAVKELESQARRVLARCVEPWSVSEWVEQHTGVLANKLTQLAEIAHRLTIGVSLAFLEKAVNMTIPKCAKTPISWTGKG